MVPTNARPRAAPSTRDFLHGTRDSYSVTLGFAVYSRERSQQCLSPYMKRVLTRWQSQHCGRHKGEENQTEHGGNLRQEETKSLPTECPGNGALRLGRELGAEPPDGLTDTSRKGAGGDISGGKGTSRDLTETGTALSHCRGITVSH